jgi:hypothetical protein
MLETDAEVWDSTTIVINSVIGVSTYEASWDSTNDFVHEKSQFDFLHLKPLYSYGFFFF